MTKLIVSIGLIAVILVAGCDGFQPGKLIPTVNPTQIPTIDIAQLKSLAEKNGVPVDMITDTLENAKTNSLELLNLYSNALLNDGKVPDNAKQLALEISSNVNSIGPVNSTSFDNYDTFREKIIQINHLIDTLNSNSGATVPIINDPKALFEKIKPLNGALEYAPVVPSYNNLYQSSIGLTPSSENIQFKRFYRDLMILGVDIAITGSGADYKAAYKSTGVLAESLNLQKLRGFTGDAGYGLTLSVIHWKFRDKFDETWADIIDLLRKEHLVE
ncbi:Uncharacterised protein [uncultured archaeon]|nr:Uncharacterised protein [uncultured archaeon]